jgi:hypothetical protein
MRARAPLTSEALATFCVATYLRHSVWFFVRHCGHDFLNPADHLFLLDTHIKGQSECS